jgi:hypothetical protein
MKNKVTEAIRTLDEHANSMDDDTLRVLVATGYGYMQILSVYEADGNLVVDVEHEEEGTADYGTFAAAYCMGAMAHGATKEEARRELQQAWKDYCGCTT